MPEINGKQSTKEEVHAALKDGRVEDVWPGATFVDHGEFTGPFKEGEIPVEDLMPVEKKK